MMTKQKLISLILKKQTYKQLKNTTNEIGKENIQAIKSAIGAVQQILTKQYNAQSRLYALRFLKDCFEMGSKHFIKLTQDNILPIIVNIIIDSTDQTAITKYAGSSFTKTTDLSKFKSIIVSFFKLAKQCVMKWAEWVPNSEYRFKAAFISLQKKQIRFQYQLKYFRPENQVNFLKNCKQNGFQLSVNKNKATTIQNANKSKQNEKSEVSKNKEIQMQKKSSKSPKQNINQQRGLQFQIGKRFAPTGNNKYILQCHEIFKLYNQKLKNGKISEKDIQEMEVKVNQKLTDYMSMPDLNQNQMESQLEPIFQNIKNVKQDYEKIKAQTNKKSLNTSNSIQNKPNAPTAKKVQSINSNRQTQAQNLTRKLQTPSSPKNFINNQIQNASHANSVSINKSQSKQLKIQYKQELKKQNKKQFEVQQKQQQSKTNLRSKKTENLNSNSSLKQKSDNSLSIETKVDKSRKKQQVFEEDNNFSQSKVNQNSHFSSIKQIEKTQRVTFKVNSRLDSQLNKSPVKQESRKKGIQKNDSSQKIERKGTKEKFERFDSNIDLSGESSRVNFTDSQDDGNSSQEDSKLTGKFKKQSTNLKLSAIPQDQREGFAQISQRNSSNMQQQSSVELPKYKVSQKIIQKPSTQIVKKKVIQKVTQKAIQKNDTVLQNQVKIPKSVIEDYERKISNLQQILQSKQSTQKQLEKRLNQLNVLKKFQQSQLEKMKQQNQKIMKQFSNAINAQQYQEVRKQFNQLRDKNRKMENTMQKLLQQIQGLKKQQLRQKQTEINLQKSRQNEIIRKQQIKVFSSSQNIPKANIIQLKSKPQKNKFTYQTLDPDYIKNKTHLSKIHQFLNENNLTLLKKNILGANQLFFTSEQISFICRSSHYKNQKLTLKLQLSFQLNNLGKKSIPMVKIPNTQEIQVWKKNIVGQQTLYHQEIVLKLKKFPFKSMKMIVSTSQNSNTQVLLPFIYFSFLRKSQFTQEQFDSRLESQKQSIIKSKVFNLNSKTLKDFKSIHFYQGFLLPEQNRICFKLYEESDKFNIFWCQITSLNSKKLFIKILPEPYTEEMYCKSQELIQNLLFLMAG